MTEKWDLIIDKEACEKYLVQGNEIHILFKDEIRKTLKGKIWCTLDDIDSHVDADIVVGTLLEFKDETKEESKNEI